MERDREDRDSEVIVLSEMEEPDGRVTFQILRVRYSGIIETVATKCHTSLESHFDRYSPNRNDNWNHLFEIPSLTVNYPLGMKVSRYEGSEPRAKGIVETIIREGEKIHLKCAVVNPRLREQVRSDFRD